MKKKCEQARWVMEYRWTVAAGINPFLPALQAFHPDCGSYVNAPKFLNYI
jgi:hypothetical protein